MEITMSTVAGVAGAVVAVGAVVAAIANMMNPNRAHMYETPGQGPVQTQYVPQHPMQQPMYQAPMYQMPIYQAPVQPMYQQPVYQQPVYQQPVYQQPVYQQQPVQPAQPTQQSVYHQPVQPVQPYVSQYPWGYNAYIACLANMPLQNQSQSFTYAYSQPTQYNGPLYTYDWDKFYRKNMGVGGSPQQMGAPPGQTPPVYPYSAQQQQASPPPQPHIDLSTIPAYVRTYANGYTSAMQIPACYNNDGSWRGMQYV